MTSPPAVIHTIRSGQGIPLVLLPAFPIDHQMWLPLVAALDPGIPVWAVDVPGAGAAPVPTEDPSLSWVADQLAEAFSHQHVVVAGISLGGYIAMALAHQHPEMIRGLALLDTKATTDTPAAKAHRLVIASTLEESDAVDAVAGMAVTLLSEQSRLRDPTLISTVREWISDQNPQGLAWLQRAMAARSAHIHTLERLQVPCAVIMGEYDAFVPWDQAKMMATACNVPVTVIPDVGHLSAVENPNAVAVALAELYQRSTSTA